MDEIDHASESLRKSVAEFRRRAFIRWVIRWTFAVILIIWVFPKYPWLYWTLIVAIPLGLWSLWSILVETTRLESKFKDLADRMREIQT